MLGIRNKLVVRAAQVAPNKQGLLEVSTVRHVLVGVVAAEAATNRIAGTPEAGIAAVERRKNGSSRVGLLSQISGQGRPSDAREVWSSLSMTFCRELVTSEQADLWMLINMKVNYDWVILLSLK
jgi:hypothetical protein